MIRYKLKCTANDANGLPHFSYKVIITRFFFFKGCKSNCTCSEDQCNVVQLNVNDSYGNYVVRDSIDSIPGLTETSPSPGELQQEEPREIIPYSPIEWWPLRS